MTQSPTSDCANRIERGVRDARAEIDEHVVGRELADLAEPPLLLRGARGCAARVVEGGHEHEPRDRGRDGLGRSVVVAGRHRTALRIEPEQRVEARARRVDVGDDHVAAELREVDPEVDREEAFSCAAGAPPDADDPRGLPARGRAGRTRLVGHGAAKHGPYTCPPGGQAGGYGRGDQKNGSERTARGAGPPEVRVCSH